MVQLAVTKSPKAFVVVAENTMSVHEDVSEGFSLFRNSRLYLEGKLLLWVCGCGHYLLDHTPYPDVTHCIKCRSCTGFHKLTRAVKDKSITFRLRIDDYNW